MKLKSLIPPLVLSAVGLTPFDVAGAATYAIDTAHSSVSFQIKHLAIAKVNGSFSAFEGTISFANAEPKTWNVQASIQLKSVETGNEERDAHLKSPDFFDIENYPVMTFVSTAVEMHSSTTGTLRGNLSLHGVTKEVELDLEFNGAETDPWGNARIGFSAYGEIARKDWGLTFNKILDSGSLMIGEKVKINLEIEAARQEQPKSLEG